MEKTISIAENLTKAFSLCTLAYLLSLAVALFVGHSLDGHHPIIIVFWADLTATLVPYLFSRLFGNASFYDAYWSLAPLPIALYWMFGIAPINVITARKILILSLVLFWGLRLTWNWVSQWRGLKDEDWRYSELRKKYRSWFWIIDLVGIEMMPTIIVFLGCLSLYPSLSESKNAFNILDVIALIFTAGAIVIETTADEQLKRFKKKFPRPGEIINRGFWAYSRHPNYLGEIIFWWGLYIFALAASPAYWWTIVGPVAVTTLFSPGQYPFNGE